MKNILDLKRIALLTSGGDSPGMNAAIRAVVRAGNYYGLDVYGIYRGYDGLIANDMKLLNARSVANILERGGTMLKSARSAEFRTPEGRIKAYENLKRREIDALITIGGDGTFAGALALSNEFGVPVLGLPGTIDNDLYGTDFTIGFDTATNVAVQAVDLIRNTAMSHNRLFFVEVMGRDSGFIAAHTAVSSGAIAVTIPEKEMTIEQLMNKLDKSLSAHKASSIVIVSEGGKSGNATDIAKKVKEQFPYFDTRVTILGHIQRGGNPTCADRILASKLGVAAVEGLLNGKTGVMAGFIDNVICYTSLHDSINKKYKFDEELVRISEILST